MYKIHYAQSWEDPRTLTNALEITTEDDVISIASSGDNTFALLLDNPHSITAIDRNPAQLFLIELKMKAIQNLDYEDFISFLGARPCKIRKKLYLYIRDSLSPAAQEYWDRNQKNIKKGVIHHGKFERYFSIFRQVVMPLIHSKKTIHQLLSSSTLKEQETFYDLKWNNRRWQWLFRVFFGKFLLGRLGRDPSFFRYVNDGNIGEVILNRSKRGLTKVPIPDNYFLEYILTGQFSNLETAHPYLQSSNFHILKERVHQLRLVCSSLLDYLRTLPPASISKLNLSDIFEYMSHAEVVQNLQEIHRVSRNGAKLAFWSLFVTQKVPLELCNHFRSCTNPPDRNISMDRTFFYGDFCLWNVKKLKRFRDVPNNPKGAPCHLSPTS